MVAISLLESSLRGTDVCLRSLVGGDFSLINYSRFQAEARERTIAWDSAIAFRCRLISGATIAKYSLVVFGKESLDTWHATVT